MIPAAPPRRYLDHPATSWPKPAPVIDGVLHALREVGAAAGRGIHADARRADAIRTAARAAAARIVGADDPQRVALVSGATLGLNVAIHGLVEPGWHVLATAADHNATLRPLQWLADRGVIEFDVVPCNAAGAVDPDDVARAWRPATRMLVFSHASNVTGTLQDAVALARIARERGGLSLLDASQTAGIVPLPHGASAPDVVVAAGHKWLQGPEGGAMLFAREGIEPRPLVEAGPPDLAALAGLSAGIGWVERQGIAALSAHGHRLASACRAALAPLPGVCLLGPGGGKGPPIVGFTVEGYDPADVATLLEQIAGVQARAGLHCAALIHRHLGTAVGGSVRLGFGPFNTPDDVRAVVAAVAAILGLPDTDSSDPFPIPTQVPPWQE